MVTTTVGNPAEDEFLQKKVKDQEKIIESMRDLLVESLYYLPEGSHFPSLVTRIKSIIESIK